jgi:hypothetical protein
MVCNVLHIIDSQKIVVLRLGVHEPIDCDLFVCVVLKDHEVPHLLVFILLKHLVGGNFHHLTQVDWNVHTGVVPPRALPYKPLALQSDWYLL